MKKHHHPKDFSELPELVRKMVERLNAALTADRIELSTLFSQSVPGQQLSSFFVATSMSQEECVVGLLGVINGLLEAAGQGNFRIYRDVDEQTDIINFFGIIEGWES